MKICITCNNEYNRIGRVCGKCIYKAKDKKLDKISKRAWYLANKERISAKNKANYLINKDEILETNKKFKEQNPEYFKEYGKEYRKLNKDKSNSYFRVKYKNDVQHRLKVALRNRINRVIRKKYNTPSVSKFLGCSIEVLISHLESQFQPGMTWKNQGKWYIDHIKPLSSFDLTKVDEFRNAVNYKNLQPLWAEDNLKKGSKIFGIRKK